MQLKDIKCGQHFRFVKYAAALPGVYRKKTDHIQKGWALVGSVALKGDTFAANGETEVELVTEE